MLRLRLNHVKGAPGHSVEVFFARRKHVPMGHAWGRDKMVDTCWHHQMETFSALLVLCAWNSLVPGEFPSQRAVTRSFSVFFDLRLNKRLDKQSQGWWIETPSCPLWGYCSDFTVNNLKLIFLDINICTLLRRVPMGLIKKNTTLVQMTYWWPAIIWTNDGLVYQHMYVSTTLDELTYERPNKIADKYISIPVYFSKNNVILIEISVSGRCFQGQH